MDAVKPDNQSRTTIYDVAASACVSISTVSLALNSPDRVKPETLARIMQAVDQLGFTPKEEAVIRARRGTGRIGVIAPFTSSPIESSLRLQGVLQGAAHAGFEVAVFDQASAATSRLVSLPVTRKVDGLIIVSVPFDDAVRRRLTDHGTPSVVVEIPNEAMSGVLIDHRGGAVLAAEYLMRKGHVRMAFVGHRQQHEYQSQSLEKAEGFASVAQVPPVIINVENTFAAAVEAGRELLLGAEPPTAVFAHDDLLAAGVLAAARQIGMRVPEDVAIIGFNDTDIAEPLGLTTVRQPFIRSGELAVELLSDRITAPKSGPQVVTVGVELVERSTA